MMNTAPKDNSFQVALLAFAGNMLVLLVILFLL
jgi:hypothetical protein